MSLFGNDRRKPGRRRSGGVATLIGDNTEIRGDLLFSGGMHVDGHIKGKVVAVAGEDASLSISETGSIEGDISVPVLVVNGAVSGNVHASEKIVLAPKSRVNGNVYYNVLEVQPGAEVNGQLVHDPNGERMPQGAGGEVRADASRVDLNDLRRNRISG